MVMGYPFTYERVLQDSNRYEWSDTNGKSVAWWEPYLASNGFQTIYRPLNYLSRLASFDGTVTALIVLQSHLMRAGHIVAADEFGIVDPGTGSPERMSLADLTVKYAPFGFEFDSDFLAVRKHPDP